MLTETFACGHSPLHRLDPRVRIVFATLFSFLAALSSGFPTLFAALAGSLLLILLAGVAPLALLGRLKVINLFNLLIWLVLPFSHEGQAVMHLGALTGTREGLLLAARITLKSNIIVLAFVALVATMPVATLGHALGRLRVPAKLVFLLLMTYRYLFVLEQEYRRLCNAARVRGFQPGTNLHTYRTYAYLFGMLLVRAAARAERVYQAMLCRGFKGRFYCLHTLALSRRDRLWCAALLLAIVILGGLEWQIALS